MHCAVFPCYLTQAILACIPVSRCRADEASSVLLHDDDADCILIRSIQGLKAFESCRNDAVGPIADFGSEYDECRVGLDLDCEKMTREVATTHGLKCASVRTDPIADLITASVSLMLKSSRASAVSVMLCGPCKMFLGRGELFSAARQSVFEI